MGDELVRVLAVLAAEGGRLRADFHLDWPVTAQQAVHVLRLMAEGPGLPPLVGIVGGASSGKSTIFNNLLDRHVVSRVTAQGHATRGLIVAVHEEHRPVVDAVLAAGRLFAGLVPRVIDLDDRVEGEPAQVAVAYHAIEALRGVLLADTPDFTSEAARREGDVLLSLLPWFDRLIVVVDRERWFDRQSITEFRTHSGPLGQERLAVFNCTQEGALSESDREALARQAERLAAIETVILEHRVGRGLCVFAPHTLDGVLTFARGERPAREEAMTAFAGQAAGQALNQNEERRARLRELEGNVRAALQRGLPSVQESLTAMMTPPEREQMEIVGRVLRLRESRAWLAEQRYKLESALRRVPVLGMLVGADGRAGESNKPAAQDRLSIGRAYYESAVRRLVHELRRAVGGSRFWDEVRRWTGLEPGEAAFAWNDEAGALVSSDVSAFDRAMSAWNRRVEEECKGFAPNMKGAVGAGVLGVAVVLVAVHGPVAMLTLPAAKVAIAAALGKLAATAGVGGLLGRHFTRLLQVVREQLIGSPEFTAVQEAAERFRMHIEQHGWRLAEVALAEARRLVAPADDPLVRALAVLCAHGERAA